MTKVNKLTKVKILAMKPGRELDEAVAIHVMKFSIHPHGGVYKQGTVLEGYRTDFNPSKNISVAWEVLKCFAQEFFVKKMVCGAFSCWIAKSDTDVENGYEITASTAEEAICKAVLLARLNI